MRLADNPRPGFCSVCFGAQPERRFIDCEADYDGAPVLDRETNTIAVLPWTGELGGHDNLYICDACVKDMCELLGLKPELHSRQFTEIRRLEVERDHWKATTRRLKDELDRQVEANLGPREPRRPRKVAA